MSDDEILERIKKVITNQLGIEPDDIKLESTFFEDLDADSLDIVELILTFEEAFKIDISDEDASNLLVVGDIVNYVALALEKKEEESGKRKKLPGELAQELNLVDPLIDD